MMGMTTSSIMVVIVLMMMMMMTMVVLLCLTVMFCRCTVLCLPELPVDGALSGQELTVRPLLHHPALVQHQDLGGR